MTTLPKQTMDKQKTTLSKVLEKVKETGRRAVTTLVTAAALSGILTSCDNKEILVNEERQEISTDFSFSSGGDMEVFNVTIQKQGSTYIAKIDGPFWNNTNFSGTKDEVFSKVEDYFVEKARDMSFDVEHVPNLELIKKVEKKMDKMRDTYYNTFGDE